MYKSRHTKRNNRKKKFGRAGTLVISLLLLTAVTLGGTIAYLSVQTQPIKNTFTPSYVKCSVTENFDGTTKSNVNVTNNGNTEAYIRVKLVTYRTNDQGQHIGGPATLPSFTLGKNWKEYGDYYYYTLPVSAGENPAANLTDSMTLTGSYSDADGGKQVIEVMAEAIQSEPAKAVGESWGVSISEGEVKAYKEQ